MTPTLDSLRVGEDPLPADGATRSPRPSRWQLTAGIIGVAVVAWVGSNLFDVITRGGGPGGPHGPSGGAPSGQVADDDAGTPGGGSPHDPSRFNH